MASAVYLLSYYTWANTNTLLSLERPDICESNVNGEWYQMPAFKRRAFRVITIQIGAHDQINIPKYSMEFFNQLLKVSKAISVESYFFSPVHVIASPHYQRSTYKISTVFSKRTLD